MIQSPLSRCRLLSFTSLVLFASSFSIWADPVADRKFSQEIDRLIEQGFRKHKVKPNPPASDDVFLRRIYLDIAGRIPTLEEVDAFDQTDAPNKRTRLIEKLLRSEAYVSHSFNYWADILRVKSDIRGDAGEPYAAWVKQSLRENKPYDKMVFELLTASGNVWDNGAVGYYMRDAGMPLDNMAYTTQVFLGTQMVCAQCHDHPFDKWKQKEFYEMAAYTYGVDTRMRPEKVLGLDKMLSRKERRRKG
ncbi:MAG: DUF1549 domain-containing protein, partial [Verrucomicrobiota bacterium]